MADARRRRERRRRRRSANEGSFATDDDAADGASPPADAPLKASLPKQKAPAIAYPGPQDGDVLALRGSLTLGSRRRYAEVMSSNVLSREDAYHQAIEFLFERLAVSWTLAGLPLTGQRRLLERFRSATAAERSWVVVAIREHCAIYFPDVDPP